MMLLLPRGRAAAAGTLLPAVFFEAMMKQVCDGILNEFPLI
ncbi:hypothetical protein L21SP2_0937 [Salinispira pacifica]|uniref:Uncharacterized protein n=1 Tax=Salinispira pacifica TaxID=1307761 RepID=V5WEX8_9SPIO|nr:hypothetical protein L21SP2_0937 [Salinispira pacifica]